MAEVSLVSRGRDVPPGKGGCGVWAHLGPLQTFCTSLHFLAILKAKRDGVILFQLVGCNACGKRPQ